MCESCQNCGEQTEKERVFFSKHQKNERVRDCPYIIQWWTCEMLPSYTQKQRKKCVFFSVLKLEKTYWVHLQSISSNSSLQASIWTHTQCSFNIFLLHAMAFHFCCAFLDLILSLCFCHSLDLLFSGSLLFLPVRFLHRGLFDCYTYIVTVAHVQTHFSASTVAFSFAATTSE